MEHSADICKICNTQVITHDWYDFYMLHHKIYTHHSLVQHILCNGNPENIKPLLETSIFDNLTRDVLEKMISCNIILHHNFMKNLYSMLEIGVLNPHVFTYELVSSIICLSRTSTEMRKEFLILMHTSGIINNTQYMYIIINRTSDRDFSEMFEYIKDFISFEEIPCPEEMPLNKLLCISKYFVIPVETMIEVLSTDDTVYDVMDALKIMRDHGADLDYILDAYYKKIS